MNNKMRVKLPGRFADEEKWYIVQFSMDNEFSYPLTGSQVEDVETGETCVDKLFSVGDAVEGEWIDGIGYAGEVVFESDTKEDCMKFRSEKKNQKKKSEGKTKKKKTPTATGSTIKKKPVADDGAGNVSKKKKESAEKRKKEKAIKQTAIDNAQELFARSLHGHVSDSSNNSRAPNIINDSALNQTNNLTNVAETLTNPIFEAPRSPTPPPSCIDNSLRPHIANKPSSHFINSAPAVTQLLTNFDNSLPLLKHSSRIGNKSLLSSTSNPSPSSSQLITSVPINQTQPSQNNSLHSFVQSSNPSQSPSNLNTSAPLTQTRPVCIDYPLPFQSSATSTHIPLSVTSSSNSLLPGSNYSSPVTHNIKFSQSSHIAKPIEPLMPLIAPGYDSSELCSSNDIPQNRYFGPYPPLLPLPNLYRNEYNNLSKPFSSSMHGNSMDLNKNSQDFNRDWSPSAQHQSRTFSSDLSFQPCVPTNDSSNLLNLSNTCMSSSPAMTSSHNTPNMHVSVTQTNQYNTTNSTTSTITRPHFSSPTSSVSNSCNLSLFSSSHECADCILKDSQITSLTNFNNKLESDVLYWKNEATRWQSELEKNMDRNTPSDQGKELERHYKPKRGLVIDKCNYVFCETEVPTDCVRLVEGHDLYVPVSWITELQGTFRGKTKPHCFKLLMNGFYQPSEITNTSAMVILNTPLGKALKAYGVVKLGMDSVAITKAINTKIGTATRAIKF